jgi:hypothetical protein
MSNRSASRLLTLLTFTLPVALTAACEGANAGGDRAEGESRPLNEYGNPMSVPARPTGAEISVADLQTRLYAFAHDSMQGRMRGREGNMKGTAYIAGELERMGLEPAGDDGTYFQSLPFVQRRYTDASTLTVDGTPLVWLEDFIAVPGQAAPLPLDGVQVVYGGVLGDTARQISAAEAEGKLVVLTRAEGAGGGGGRGGGGRGGGAGGQQRFLGAAALATVDLHTLGPSARALINDPPAAFVNPASEAPQPAPANLRVTPEGAATLLGRPIEGLAPGATGGSVRASLDFESRPTPDYTRNVVAILRGSDPVLSQEYVSLGAHPDHVGYNAAPVDHDSARAYARIVQSLTIQDTALVTPSPETLAAIALDLDSLRQRRPARLDSISNGADDDGSGSMALLEIAEALASAPVRPRRSILFVWNNSEEGGLLGSQWFVDNPPVPLETIVANLNMDMIGRGRAEDVPGGSDDLVFVIGSYNDSRELGDIVAEVNDMRPRPLGLDYRLDPPTTWPGYNNLYGRSDHINYARRGIPIAFFFTGLHYDYHRVTDEPQYIHYPKLERIARLVHDVAVELGNRDERPAMNPPTPD